MRHHDDNVILQHCLGDLCSAGIVRHHLRHEPQSYHQFATGPLIVDPCIISGQRLGRCLPLAG